MSQTKPQRKSGVASRRLGEECLLYDDERDHIHVLNRTAQLVWELCDGEHTVAEIESHVRGSFDVPGDADVTGDVSSILEEFGQLGVLEARPAEEAG